MRTIEDPSGDVLETRSGGGCLMLFGLPFFVAGIFVMGASTGLWAQKGRPPPWYFGVPFGAVFATVGAAFIFGRRGVRIDRRRGTVTEWWGPLFPFWKKDRPFAPYDHVSLTRELRKSKNSTYEVFPVRLRGGAPEAKVGEPRDYKRARREAEKVAAFVGLDLVDSTAGAAVRRRAAELDLSLREQARRAGIVVDVPNPPPGAGTRCEVEGDRVILHLPDERSGASRFATLVGGALGPVVFLAFFLLSRPFRAFLSAPGAIKFIPIGFIALVAGVPLVLALVRAASGFRGGTRVVASPQAIEIHRPGVFGPKVSSIPALELEELLLPEESDGGAAVLKALEGKRIPGVLKGALVRFASARRPRRRGIIARSDRVTLEFGEGLPDAERRWVYAVIMKMMTL